MGDVGVSGPKGPKVCLSLRFIVIVCCGYLSYMFFCI